MADDRRPGSTTNGDASRYFNKGRLTGGLLLLGAAVVLMGWDAFSVDYQLDSGQLALMLATSLALLGVEAGKAVLGSIFGGK